MFVRFAPLLVVLSFALSQCKTHDGAVGGLLDTDQGGKPGGDESVLTSNAWLEIDKDAFENNIRELQKKLGPRTKMCAVMKADAYGHGISLLIPSVVSQGVPCVAITSNEEARLVRKGGFTGQLMRIRTAIAAEIEAGFAFNLEETIGNLQLARAASEAAQKAHRTLNIHIALNAGGMSRNGLEMEVPQIRDDAVAITKLDGLAVVGIMTHYAVEEKADVEKGLAKFNEQAAWLIDHAKLDRTKITLHTANSYATLEVPQSRLDMVRPGGALYGDTVPTYVEFKRVMAFKSRVAAVNFYPKGNTVNYDRTYVLKRDSKLANIPAGYSDGYRRVFSNKSFVLIRGRRFPIVGRVTMNTIMVDVTDDPDVKPSDEVVLFGKQGNAEITQEELETASGSILADLYTVWGSCNPRILKQKTTR